MTITNHIISGAVRSARSWKWVIITWFINFILIALVVYPFRSGILNMLGSSMITEKLSNGLNLDVLANSGTGLSLLISFLTAGVIILIIASFIINIFLSGGFFDVIKRKESDLKSRGFFGASSSNFWSFFVISLLVRLMINLISFFIIGLPLIILATGGSGSEVPKILMITGGIFLLILPIFLLVTDYARAWQAASPKKDAIRALGNGFRYTFRYFFSSWLMMLVILVLQVSFTIFAFVVITRIKPDSSGGIFALFLLSQAMFMVKLFLRTWRYGIVTSKFEAHS
jgi:hypothetical protein